MKKYLLYTCCMFLLPALLFAQQTDIQKQIKKLIQDASYQDALALIEKHEPNSKEENILIRNLQAEILIRQGNLNEAAESLQQISALLALIDNPEKAEGITYTNLGFLQLNLGRYDMATENLQLALDLFERAGAGSSAEAARAFSFLGQVYSTSGKHNQAIDHQLRALEIRTQLFGEVHEDIAASYNDLGFAFSLLNPDAALDYYEKALNLYQQLYSASNPRIAQANINIGFIYAELEFYGDAIINFEEALEIWKSIYPEPHPNKAIALSYLGRTYNRMGDSEAALAYFEQAKEIYQQSYGNKHPDLAQLHNQIAIIHINNSDYQQALDHLQQAIIANVVDFNERNPELNPAINQFYNGTALLYSLHSKAKAYEARHYFKSLKFKDLEKALGSLQACDTLIEQLRRQSSNESDKLAVSAIATEVYEDGVRLSKNMSEITWKTKIFRELSFYFSEKSKSAVLLDAISDSEAKSFANIPDALLEEEKALKATIAFCAQKLAEKPGEDEERALREAYFDLNRDYEAFVKRLEIEYPEYFNLKFNSTAPDVASVQQKLKPNQALISYFIAEREQRLYIYLITHKSFKIESKAIDKNFERYLTGFRNSIYFQDNDTYFLTAHDLYKQLMPSKIPGYVKDLVIIPVGRMGTIPFEALLTKRIKQTDVNFEDLSYLVNDYSITYEFATSLILQENKTKDIANNNILLCAPVKFTSNRLLPELPASETEVNKIEELFNANQYQSTSLTFEDACEDKLKSKDLKQYRLLHFATHGIVDEVHPELSRIFLNAAAGSGEDGNLFSGEIYNLEMDADLVVLSACQTGLGKVSKGEGVIGLSRALVYAGARKLIVSYWSVADNSTAVLMMNFYRNLINQNELKESAAPLRMAKLDMIKAKEFADPYYWAPFILIGY